MSAEERLVRDLVAAHPEDAARLLERDGGAGAAAVLAELGPPLAAEVLRRMEPVAAAGLLAATAPAAAAALVAAVPIAAGAALLRRLDAAARDRLLAALPPSPQAEGLRRLLRQTPGTAGALLDPLAPVVHEAANVAEVLDRIRRSSARGLDCVFVVGEEQRLRGVVAHQLLLSSAPEATMASVMTHDPERIGAHASVAAIVAHPAWRRQRALPVVDGEGRFLGAVGHETLRQLEGEARRAGPAADPGATAVALGELYGLALGGLAAWAAAAARGGARPGREPPP